MSEVFNRVEFLLRERGLRRVDLCRATGIAESAIRAWRNAAEPSGEKCVKVADFFGVSVRWLITGEEENGSSTPADSFRVNTEEEELIRNYRVLKTDHKESVRIIVTALAQAVYSNS